MLIKFSEFERKSQPHFCCHWSRRGGKIIWTAPDVHSKNRFVTITSIFNLCLHKAVKGLKTGTLMDERPSIRGQRDQIPKLSWWISAFSGICNIFLTNLYLPHILWILSVTCLNRSDIVACGWALFPVALPLSFSNSSPDLENLPECCVWMHNTQYWKGHTVQGSSRGFRWA